MRGNNLWIHNFSKHRMPLRTGLFAPVTVNFSGRITLKGPFPIFEVNFCSQSSVWCHCLHSLTQLCLMYSSANISTTNIHMTSVPGTVFFRFLGKKVSEQKSYWCFYYWYSNDVHPQAAKACWRAITSISSSMLELILLHPLAPTLMVPSKIKKEREANGPASTLIRVYNALNRSPKGLTGWINHKRAFLCRKKHSQPQWKKRLIDREEKRRGDSSFLQENVEKEEGKLGEWKDGGVLKRGDKTLASVLSERKARISQDDGLKEGGRQED